MDFLKDEENALIVSARDVKKMTHAIERLILNENIRHSMKRSNHRMIKDYEIGNIAQQYITLFEDAIHGRASQKGRSVPEDPK